MTNEVKVSAVGDPSQMSGAELLSYGPHFPAEIWNELCNRQPAGEDVKVRMVPRMTATFNDPEHPGRDIHGVDHGAMQEFSSAGWSQGVGSDQERRTVTVLLKCPVTYSEFQSLVQHLRSWHPCVGFADGK